MYNKIKLELKQLPKDFKILVLSDIPYNCLNRDWDKFTKDDVQTFCTRVATLLRSYETSVCRVYCGDSQVKTIRKFFEGQKYTVPKTNYQWVYPKKFLKVTIYIYYLLIY